MNYIYICIYIYTIMHFPHSQLADSRDDTAWNSRGCWWGNGQATQTISTGHRYWPLVYMKEPTTKHAHFTRKFRWLIFVNPRVHRGLSLPMTDPWCCYIWIIIYGNMDTINIPQCWHIYQHHGFYGLWLLWWENMSHFTLRVLHVQTPGESPGFRWLKTTPNELGRSKKPMDFRLWMFSYLWISPWFHRLKHIEASNTRQVKQHTKLDLVCFNNWTMRP